ncbi:growth hormone-inducible soluble protein-like protein [Lipomyces tetrasporus]
MSGRDISTLRSKVIRQYKQLLFMGREYPRGYKYFRDKVHAGFKKNADLTDAEEIEQKLKFAEYIEREIAALYHVRKYRAMKQRYYDNYR